MQSNSNSSSSSSSNNNSDGWMRFDNWTTQRLAATATATATAADKLQRFFFLFFFFLCLIYFYFYSSFLVVSARVELANHRRKPVVPLIEPQSFAKVAKPPLMGGTTPPAGSFHGPSLKAPSLKTLLHFTTACCCSSPLIVANHFARTPPLLPVESSQVESSRVEY